MDCGLSGVCGGCSLRHLSLIDYQEHKISLIRQSLQSITRQDFNFSKPIFIQDGNRRRASMNFRRIKGKVHFGFNGYQSNEIAEVSHCSLLTKKINRNLEFIKGLLDNICNIPINIKTKKKKNNTVFVESGDIWITEADNGLDIVLEFDYDLNLDMRMTIFEEVQKNEDIIRISHRKNINQVPETIMEKTKPYLNIADFEVYIPAGTFLQPSKEGEQTLVNLVMKYLGTSTGKIADLFCGVGTFSYPLAKNLENKIVAIDSSGTLLSGFQDSVNRQMISNIEIINKNLFKYPLDASELKEFDVVVFDPPRAGAKEQVTQLAQMNHINKPKKLIAVSCNPNSFVRDANILIEGGYELKDITIVDQFIYSKHSELVALFEISDN